MQAPTCFKRFISTINGPRSPYVNKQSKAPRNFLFRLKTPLSFVNAANLIAIIFSTCHWSRIKLRMCILQVSHYFWEKSNFVIWAMALQSESACLWTPETQGHQPWNFWADRIGFFTLYKQSVTYLVLQDELDPGHCLFTLLEILRKVGTVSQGSCQVTIDQCPSFKRVWCYTLSLWGVCTLPSHHMSCFITSHASAPFHVSVRVFLTLKRLFGVYTIHVYYYN